MKWYRTEYKVSCLQALIACTISFMVAMGLTSTVYNIDQSLVRGIMGMLTIALWLYAACMLGAAATIYIIDRYEKKQHEQGS